jgi:hypothetical protein
MPAIVMANALNRARLTLTPSIVLGINHCDTKWVPEPWDRSSARSLVCELRTATCAQALVRSSRADSAHAFLRPKSHAQLARASAPQVQVCNRLVCCEGNFRAQSGPGDEGV